MSNTYKRIPLYVQGKDEIVYSNMPVTFGVPFPDGELKRGDNIRIVNNKGETFPVQKEIVTTWGPKSDHVKWLLIDTQILPDSENDYFLEYGKESRPDVPDQKIEIEEAEDSFIINNGALALKIRHTFKPGTHPHNPNFFTGCELKTGQGWQEIFQNNPGPYLYMTDQSGNIYDSFTGGLEEVALEDVGPLRVCIRIKGYHTGKGGVRFCPYVLRIHLFAGFKFIKIQHTFIFDQDPRNVELSSVGMKFPLKLGHNQRGSFAGSQKSHFVTNWKRFEFLQNGESNYEIHRNGEIFDNGDKTSGWGSLNGTEGSALSIVKNPWQEYPKGISLNHGAIDVQIWPHSYDSNLSFTTPFDEPAVELGNAIDHSVVGSENRENVGVRDENEFKQKLKENPTAPLNLASLHPVDMDDMEWIEEMVEKYAPERAKSFSRDIHLDNGVGAAKTTDIYLFLDHNEISDKQAESIAGQIQEPIIASASPDYICSTGVFGHLYPAGDPGFSQIDEGLDKIHELGSECNYTGMMEYGNSNTGHVLDSLVYQYYKNKDHEKIREYCAFNNEARDEMMSAWCKFIRTGDRLDYLRAVAYTGNVADVAYIHSHPFNPACVGLMHYHGPHPWSGFPCKSHTLVTGLLTHYYFTGNKRLLEVARESADCAVRSQTPAGILPSEGGLIRDIGAPLSVLMEMYQATWEEKYADPAKRTLNWLLRTAYEPGIFPQRIASSGKRGDRAVVSDTELPEVSWGNSYYWYKSTYRLFPNKTLEDHIIGLANYYTWRLPLDLRVGMYDESAVVCLAYDITHDFAYAAFAKHISEHNFLHYVKNNTDGFGITYFNGFIPRLLYIVADAMERDPEGFSDAEKKWKEKREKTPLRESRKRPGKPSKDIGPLSTEPHKGL